MTNKKFLFRDVNYLLTYPTVGQKLKIEQLKLLLSNNMYSDLVRSAHNTAVELLDLIDSISFLSVMIPDLKLKVSDFENMSYEDSMSYRNFYVEEIYPWLTEVEAEFKKWDKEMREKKTKIAEIEKQTTAD